MGLLDILNSKDQGGAELRSGLLHAGLGMLQGSYGNYGSFMPALAGGASGFARGQDLARMRVMQDEEMEFRREQSEQNRMFREVQMMGVLDGLEANKRARQQEAEAASWLSGGVAPTAQVSATAAPAGGGAQTFPVSSIGAPPPPTVATRPAAGGFDYTADPEFQRIEQGMKHPNPAIRAQAGDQYKLYMERLKSNPEHIATIKAAEVQGKAQAERRALDETEQTNSQKRLEILDRVIAELPNASSGRVQNIGTGTAEFFGVSTDASKADAMLDTLAGELLRFVPRFEGPQSDKDVQAYREMAGDIANPNLPVGTRLSIARKLKERLSGGTSRPPLDEILGM